MGEVPTLPAPGRGFHSWPLKVAFNPGALYNLVITPILRLYHSGTFGSATNCVLMGFCGLWLRYQFHH